MKSEDLVILLDDILIHLESEEEPSASSVKLFRKVSDAIDNLSENVNQLVIHNKKNNILEPSHIRLVDGITFENSHLVAEHLIKKDIDIANALYEELKAQRKGK